MTPPSRPTHARLFTILAALALTHMACEERREFFDKNAKPNVASQVDFSDGPSEPRPPSDWSSHASRPGASKPAPTRPEQKKPEKRATGGVIQMKRTMKIRPKKTDPGEARGFDGLGVAGAERGETAGVSAKRGIGAQEGGEKGSLVGDLGEKKAHSPTARRAARQHSSAEELRRREARYAADRAAQAAQAAREYRELRAKREAERPRPDEALAVQLEPEVMPRSSFEDHGVNPMTATSDDPLSTFSVDVDTASYSMTRRTLSQLVMPYASSVRVEEFINYFTYDYPDPSEGVFGVSLEMAPSPFSPGTNRHFLRVGIQGKRLDEASRKPLNLVFLVDTSGSMEREDRLPLAKQALDTLVDRLDARDRVALVSYASQTRVVLPSTGGDQKATLREGIASLRASGGTAMADGMELAYQQALQNAKPGMISRVVVLSDGDANIGQLGANAILNRIHSYVEDGVALSTVGLGADNYKDARMERLAQYGDGNYTYIDGPREAARAFGERLDATMEIIARDVKIQVEFDPEYITSYRLIGYENRDIADQDFRNDQVDAGEVGAGHSVTAIYEVTLAGAPSDHDLAIVRLRYKDPESRAVTEQVAPLRATHMVDHIDHASPSYKLALAALTFAELLRGSPYVSHVSLATLIDFVQKKLTPLDPTEHADLIALLEHTKYLVDTGSRLGR